MDVCNRFNSISHQKPIKKVDDLNPNEEYKIIDAKNCNSKYGKS
jgi:hypothetical protein